jgi:hypothetical protein
MILIHKTPNYKTIAKNAFFSSLNFSFIFISLFRKVISQLYKNKLGWSGLSISEIMMLKISKKINFLSFFFEL